jgi:hypothetical protein
MSDPDAPADPVAAEPVQAKTVKCWKMISAAVNNAAKKFPEERVVMLAVGERVCSLIWFVSSWRIRPLKRFHSGWLRASGK